jgi:hypothetical protein
MGGHRADRRVEPYDDPMAWRRPVLLAQRSGAPVFAGRPVWAGLLAEQDKADEKIACICWMMGFNT